MRGIIKENPGQGARLVDDLPIPSLAEHEVLVKVTAAAVCATDRHIYEWTTWARKRVTPPCILGHEVAGVIEEIGKDAKGTVGQKVALESHIPCHSCNQCWRGNGHLCENCGLLGVNRSGGFAQYVTIQDDCVFPLPDSFTGRQAALMEPLGAAVHGVDRAQVQGKRIAVLGCGPIGLMTIGAARLSGASLVVATDVIPSRLERAKAMGADITLDVTDLHSKRLQEVRQLSELDVVINCSDSVEAILGGLRSLRRGGTLVSTGLPQTTLTFDISEELLYRELTLKGTSGRALPQTWEHSLSLVEQGLDLMPVLGREYSLFEFDQAIRHLVVGLPGQPTLHIG